MVYRKAMGYGVLSGLVVMMLVYGAFTVDSNIPTGKVSATMFDYSLFSYIVGFLVIVMTILIVKYEMRERDRFL